MKTFFFLEINWFWARKTLWNSAKIFFFEITWFWAQKTLWNSAKSEDYLIVYRKTSQSDLRLMIIWVKVVHYCFELQKKPPPFAKSWLRDWPLTVIVPSNFWLDITCLLFLQNIFLTEHVKRPKRWEKSNFEVFSIKPIHFIKPTQIWLSFRAKICVWRHMKPSYM